MSGVEAILYSGHQMLATLASVPELVISEQEAAMLTKASERVARHYDLPDLPQKMVDWAHLFMALGAVYGTRFIAIRAKRPFKQKPATLVVDDIGVPVTTSNGVERVAL